MSGIKIIYKVSAREFSNFNEAEKYENEQKNSVQRKVDEVLYGRSFKDCTWDQSAWFMIYDEGPVDFGSSGNRQFLDLVYGTPREVAEYAVSLKGFWGYGPGEIRRVEPTIL